MRHLAKVYITPELMTELLTEGYKSKPIQCVAGLPQGAILVNARLAWSGDIEMWFSHASFSAVAEKSEPEMIITPTFIVAN